MLVDIRSFKKDELDEILSLYKETFLRQGVKIEDKAETFRTDVLRAIETDLPGDILIAVEQDEILGFASFLKIEIWHFGPFMVKPSVQHKGIGKALLSKSLSSMKDAGGGRITLTVQKNNAAAIELYEQVGFRVSSYIMELEL